MSRVAVLVIGILATVTGAAAGQNVPAAPAQKQEYQLTNVPPLPMGGLGGSRPTQPAADFRRLSRYSFKIDPKTPVEELLPNPPQVKAARGPLIGDDLRTVTEIEFQGRTVTEIESQGRAETPARDRAEETAHQIAKARFLDETRTDGFLLALRARRSDLSGLPFQMGNNCRSSKERARDFAEAARDIRFTLSSLKSQDHWLILPHFLDRNARSGKEEERSRPSQIAALMQIMGDESLESQTGLVNYLDGVSHEDATRALAKMTIFSTESKVRDAAIAALRVRREKDYTDILLGGLKYPSPAVAQRSTQAIGKLQRLDLLLNLVAVLDAPDPRSPQNRELDGKTGPVVRELVRVNHLTSCLMCHPPAGTKEFLTQTAPVPVPGTELPPRTEFYYGSLDPDFAIRFDVTYLRQDFSAMLPVENAAPWPKMQRFDFLVRERMLDEKEAALFTAALAQEKSGESPYRLAALRGLKELTGKDRSAAEWRNSVASKP